MCKCKSCFGDPIHKKRNDECATVQFSGARASTKQNAPTSKTRREHPIKPLGAADVKESHDSFFSRNPILSGHNPGAMHGNSFKVGAIDDMPVGPAWDELVLVATVFLCSSLCLLEDRVGNPYCSLSCSWICWVLCCWIFTVLILLGNISCFNISIIGWF